jgi:hypothetical protein
MQYKKLSIQFASISNLWAFRKAIGLNNFHVNLAKLTLTFECSDQEKIGQAIEQYYGQIVPTMQKV